MPGFNDMSRRVSTEGDAPKRPRSRRAFFTNSDLRDIERMPSTSLSPSTRRMFLILVSPLTFSDEPLTLTSLMTITESPDWRMLPLASRTAVSCSAAGASAIVSLAGFHSWAQVGQTRRPRSK